MKRFIGSRTIQFKNDSKSEKKTTKYSHYQKITASRHSRITPEQVNHPFVNEMLKKSNWVLCERLICKMILIKNEIVFSRHSMIISQKMNHSFANESFEKLVPKNEKKSSFHIVRGSFVMKWITHAWVICSNNTRNSFSNDSVLHSGESIVL